MFYFVAIPVAALLFYSYMVLTKKYLGHEPAWLKFYALFVIGYAIIVPIMLIAELSSAFHWSGKLSASLMAIIGFAIFFSFIKLSPKEDK